MLQCLHALEVRMYRPIDHIISNKKYVWCGITVMFLIGAWRNCSNFDILLLRYESPMTGPGADLRRLDCLNIKNFVSCKKSFSADGIQTKDHVKHGWSVI